MNELKDMDDQSGSSEPTSEVRYHIAPVTTLTQVEAVRNEVKQIVSARFVEETPDLRKAGGKGHYGVIPGTQNKSLLLPGAQLLSEVFGFYPDPILEEKEEDWDAPDVPRLTYTYKVYLKLQGDGRIVGAHIGTCSSWESKYKYRKDDTAMKELGAPECPECKAPILARSKQPDRQTNDTGYYCWTKKGGCGATFHSQDPAVAKALAYHQSALAAARTQSQGKRMFNPDIADSLHTIKQMAIKRGFVAAIRSTLHIADMYTDTAGDPENPEDVVDAEWAQEEVAAPPPKKQVNPDQELGTEGFNNLFNALKARKRTKSELANLLSLAGVVNVSLDHEKYPPELMAVFAILRHHDVVITRASGATKVERLTNRVFDIAYQALCA